MKNSIWVKLVLAVSGITGLGIGMAIVFWPRAFSASSGIILGEDISMMSEVRAPGMVLVLFGIVMLAAVVVSQIRKPALWAAALLYLSYGLGRVMSVALDGVPHVNLVMALGIELIIGLLCLYVLRVQRVPA